MFELEKILRFRQGLKNSASADLCSDTVNRTKRGTMKCLEIGLLVRWDGNDEDVKMEKWGDGS